MLTPALSISQAANTSAAVPGQTVTYTWTVANTGQTPYTGAVATDTLRELDDAAYNNDAVASAGSVSYASPVLTWTGDLAVGATVTITFSVTVNNPDTGTRCSTSVASANTGSNCLPGNGSPACNLTIPVLTPRADPHLGREHRDHHPRRQGQLHSHHRQYWPDALHRRECHRRVGRGAG